MNRLLLTLFAVLCLVQTGFSQLLTWTPDFPKDNDNITITVDAAKGNQGLMSYANTNDVYVHIGVITSASTNSSDWKYSPFVWGTTPANGKAASLGNNKYSYTISNIRSFFNVPAAETILRIAILFRNGAGTAVQRNADGSDMYVPVYSNEPAVKFTQPLFQPKYNPEPEQITKTVNDNITISGVSNMASILNIYLNNNLIKTEANATTVTANPVLTTAGSNTVKIEAVSGSNTADQSFSFFVSGGVTTAPLPAGVSQGINYHSGTSVTLVLYAPGKTRVSVIGDFPGSNWTEQSAYQMNKTADGNYWWLQINNLTAGTEYAYQYLVDGSLKIADPYAEKILDPGNDQYINAATYPSLKSYPAGQSGIVSVLQTNAPAYSWVNNNFNRPDKRNLFIYELLLRDFVAAHNWQTLKDTLSYLKRLGVNTIELLPVNEFEGNESWGYNPDFYFAPDKYYGTKNKLKEFIDACHGQGIAVVMDIALNHSFGQSPMVQLYWDAANNRPAANNPWYNPVAKHAFNVGYDMNHESGATNYFFSRVVEHWLREYKVDGFRFDLSKGFTQKQTCDATGGNCDVNGWSAYDASRIVIWKKYYDTLQLKSAGSYVILEHFAANDEEKELSSAGMMLWGNANHAFNEATMGWLANSNFEGGLHAVRGWSQPGLVTYMESHDEERLAFKNINYGNSAGSYNIKDTTTSLKRNEMAAAFLMSMPGPKMIWQFGELGYDYPINYCTDGTVKDECRTGNKPIRWDYKAQARRQQLYNVYMRMAALKKGMGYDDLFIANGATIEQDLSGAVKWMKQRAAGDTAMVVVIGNFDVTAKSISFTFPKAGKWTDQVGGTQIDATGAAQTILLQPGEYFVYTSKGDEPEEPEEPNEPVENFAARFYPNPYDATSSLHLELPELAVVQFALYNMAGQQVLESRRMALAGGRHVVKMTDKMNALMPGVYLLQIMSGNNKTLVKIVKP